jgi:hypothetical protein
MRVSRSSLTHARPHCVDQAVFSLDIDPVAFFRRFAFFLSVLDLEAGGRDQGG